MVEASGSRSKSVEAVNHQVQKLPLFLDFLDGLDVICLCFGCVLK